MPYRKAWAHLKSMEERLGIKLVERRAGGKDGGGAVLTENARKILYKYGELEKGLQKIIDERFREIFRRGPS